METRSMLPRVGTIFAACICLLLCGISAAGQGTTVVWSSAGPGPAVYSIAFSGNGRVLATGGEAGVLRLWTYP
ncbi:MAG: hypothetical protein ACP5R4_11925, partial [Armatimonadota bacterium]